LFYEAAVLKRELLKPFPGRRVFPLI
jgi:hypothetical protein